MHTTLNVVLYRPIKKIPFSAAPPPVAPNVRGSGTSRSWRRARPGPRRAARRAARPATGAPGPPTYHEPSAVGRRLGAHTPPASADRPPSRPGPAAVPGPPAAGGRHTTSDTLKRPRVEASSIALGGLGPTSTSRPSSGRLSPATRRRVRPAGAGMHHPLPPGPTQSTRPSPETAPQRTPRAPPTACHPRPYDYGWSGAHWGQWLAPVQ